MPFSEIDNPSYKLLLVEDNDIDRTVVIRALGHCPAHFDIDHAYALDDCEGQKGPYDIIVSDMNLPDSYGLDTISTLIEKFGKTPIVVVSGTDDNLIALQSVNVGAQDYLPKQYLGDSGLVYRTLRHAMERHQLKLGLEETRDRERFLARYDQCTSLPNRFLLLDRMQQAINLAKRNKTTFSLFFIDLDGFKNVNDSFGHGAGDELLRIISERLMSMVRDSDTVGRFGGDEFVILLQGGSCDKAMAALAKRMIRAINEPVPCGRHVCTVGASIGISRYPMDADTSEQLLKSADMAMYDAKEHGRNRVHFFNEALSEKKKRSLSIEMALRDALANPNDQFSLHFQPRVNLKNGEVYAVEALIRWQHPRLGKIQPDQFIPVAESLGLIDQIDEWVLEQACKKSILWLKSGMHIRIGINLSGHSWNRKSFVDKTVSSMLDKYSLAGDCLEFEMTEAVLISEDERVVERLRKLKHLGINIALDDFGTGFSSLSYLSRFPIDTLKIDGSFICDHNSSCRKKALLEAIIRIGQAMDMCVVVEKVETEHQTQLIKSMSCDEGQGFYLGRPSAAWEPRLDIHSDSLTSL